MHIRVKLLNSFCRGGFRKVLIAILNKICNDNVTLFTLLQTFEINVLKRIVKPGDTLLFKGSRSMRMELILDGFLKDE